MQAYLDHYRKQSFWLVFGAQLLIVFIVAIIALVTNQYQIGSIAFWLMVLACIIIGVSIHYCLLLYMTRPAVDLVKAVVLVAGEPTDTTPPNPNIPRYEHNGFREILQTVYELSTVASSEPTPQSSINDIIAEGLTNTSTGVLILDKDRKVIYHNPKAPVRIDPSDNVIPELVFDGDISLDKWLDECDQNAVHAERTWQRVPSKLPGEHGRRIYDVTASYSKNSRAETILTLFDRTAVYSPEEDDMDFISFAAHELRGPITVIRGYLDVLDDELQPVLKDDQAELLGRLIVSSNRLSSYVSNILNASRYDRRHLKFHVTEQTLTDSYDLIKDDMQLRAVAQNRLLIVNIPDDLPTVAIDINGISEVLGNLIDNAIKYSNEGGQVLVTAKVVGNFVQVSIEDHGIGMPSNVLGNLFHKFYRSHRSRETVAGTGIGLYISKAIVESHGGTIDVRSTENKGSTFSFTVPIYASVADKLNQSGGSNERLIERGGGWIKNHSLFRG
jgi:signal transduction histidine kinase